MDSKPDFEAAALSAPASRDKADAFFEEHARLARLQAEELREEIHLHHWRLTVEHWSGVLKLVFEITLGVVVLLVLAGLAMAVWDAAHDKALVIESFSVPSELSDRGLNGQTLAAHLQDKLIAMQNATQSVRPADSYANNWGDDIKVQIPETGVSIGEVRRLLVAWLGHQTHITGDVTRTAAGVAITVRTGGDGASTIAGPESDLDRLLQQAAESIYLRTQPYRYAVYLQTGGAIDWARVRAIFDGLLFDRSPRERAWAHIGLANIASNNGDNPLSLAELHKAAAELPGFALPWQNMAGGESSMGHEEDAVAHAAIAIRLLPDDREVEPALRAAQLPLTRGEMELLGNDYAAALRDYGKAAQLPVSVNIAETVREQILLAQAFLHDAASVHAGIAALPPIRDPSVEANRNAILLLTQYALGRWSALTEGYGKLEDDLVRSAKASGTSESGVQATLDRLVKPYIAIALAMQGDGARAQAMVAPTPLDCDICLRARGRVAARQHRWAAAQYWFQQAVRHAPSIALGYSDWGRALLMQGDLAGAIAQFAEANRKQPHFSDPLELWGETLILQNRSDLAIAKFEQAARYAPNWARLHLKWGEAMHWLGRNDEAAAQWVIASHLSLTKNEQALLHRCRHI